MLEDMLRDRLVCGIAVGSIQRRLLAEPELTLKKTVDFARRPRTRIATGGRSGHRLGLCQEHRRQISVIAAAGSITQETVGSKQRCGMPVRSEATWPECAERRAHIPERIKGRDRSKHTRWRIQRKTFTTTIFQRAMKGLIQGVPHMVAYMDDLLVMRKATCNTWKLFRVNYRPLG